MARGSPGAKAGTGFWQNPAARAAGFQILVIVAVIGLGTFLIQNMLANMSRQSIASGFGFMGQEAGFDISETLIDYSPGSTYARAFLVGLLNTVLVAGTGIVLATVLGTLIGIARLSRNWLLSRVALVYVEVVRNIPLLLQLFLWHSLIQNAAPPPREAWRLPGDIFISNRGLVMPVPKSDPAYAYMGAALAAAILLAVGVRYWTRRRQAATGRQFPVLPAAIALVVGLPMLAFVAAGAPMALDLPQMTGFNFQGGGSLSPEFAALLFGLVIYTASYIAEIVRGGILAVGHGQVEAAEALGLSGGSVMRLVILPQALRLILPPLTSQYLNLTKNSTLAVAIGYPDLVLIANTQINQTGQALEGMAIILSVYLGFSLTISLAMNLYNAAIAIKGR